MKVEGASQKKSKERPGCKNYVAKSYMNGLGLARSLDHNA